MYQRTCRMYPKGGWFDEGDTVAITNKYASKRGSLNGEEVWMVTSRKCHKNDGFWTPFPHRASQARLIIDSPTGMGCHIGPGPLSPATQVSSSTPRSGPWDRSRCCLSSGIDVRTHLLQHGETLRVSRLRTFQRRGVEGIFHRDLPQQE